MEGDPCLHPQHGGYSLAEATGASTRGRHDAPCVTEGVLEARTEDIIVLARFGSDKTVSFSGSKSIVYGSLWLPSCGSGSMAGIYIFKKIAKRP